MARIALAVFAFWFLPIISMAALPLCPKYDFTKKEFSFENFNPATEVFNGIEFPGTKNTLYRGIYESNQQYNLNIALKALFLQNELYIGSPIFFALTQVLTGEWNLDSPFFPSGNLPHKVRVYFDARRIMPDLQLLLDCMRQRPMDLTSAQIFAADLLNKSFQRMSKLEIEARYFNIKDPQYYEATQQQLGFGNNAADLVISTSYDSIAALYGNKILVFKDARRRSLDLGFYNFKKNGFFFEQWVDNGEINSPGYIRANEVVGFQMRNQDRQRTNWARSMSTNTIDVAFYRAEFKNTIVTLVLDGENKMCVIKSADNRYYECNPTPREILATPIGYPNIKSKEFSARSPLLGIITNCSPKSDECPKVSDVEQWYGKNSSRVLNDSLVKKIQDTQVNGLGLVWQPVSNQEEAATINSEAQPPIAKSNTIKVLSASYLTEDELSSAEGNVTTLVAQYLRGKNKALYRISNRYLHQNNPDTPRRFEIKWHCGDESLGLQSLSVPAPAEGKSLWIQCPGSQEFDENTED